MVNEISICSMHLTNRLKWIGKKRTLHLSNVEFNFSCLLPLSKGNCGKRISTYKIIPIIILVFFFFYQLNAQTKKTANQTTGIKQKMGELSQIREEITSLENELKLKSKKERESYSVLENYNKQSYLLHSLINKLKAEEQKKEFQINDNERRQAELQDKVKRLKENYSKYVVSIYKHGPVSEWMSLLDAESFEQALLRYKYLEKFSERRAHDLTTLKHAEDSLLIVKNQLEQEKQDKILFTQQKQNEEKTLEGKKLERKKIISAIRNDKAALLSEINARKNAELKIKNLIDKLIKDEEAKRNAELEKLAVDKLKNSRSNSTKKSEIPDNESSTLTNYDLNLSTAGFSSFSNLKGKLNWPVRVGSIVKKFGENKNERLNTVTLNYGIDIKTLPEENVFAVAEGVVSVIDWLPGYGSVVIITHKGGYRTVYSHLSNIFVKEGDKVKMGTVIGEVGESLEGNILHFEIWNSRDKQNPENWLARK